MNLENFIAEKVTKRSKSMFREDIERHYDELRNKIQRKRILVIGGAGSIGSSFIKAILEFHPKTLVVVDINENALAELTRDLRSSYGIVMPEEYITYPMDFYAPVFAKMFKKHRGFDIVANFSAHKHVRSEKDVYSIEALIQNNVIHAKALLDLLEEYPPEEYFCVSTDKAANPVNIMGASKRIMEDLIFSYSDKFPVKTARFANVAFSNGSLPAGFLERISKQQPISAPNDVKRYFVSPEESGQICMLSCILGENRAIFFPKLEKEQMMRFDDIAVELLKEYNYEIVECSSDIEAIEISKKLQTGLESRYPVHFEASNTSGEKQFEEFYVEGEHVDKDRFKALGVITDKQICNRDRLETLLKSFNIAFAKNEMTKEEIVKIIGEYLDNFEHIETGMSLDGKM